MNLFSDVSTLYEQYGEEYLNEKVLKNLDFYTKKLLYGIEWNHGGGLAGRLI